MCASEIFDFTVVWFAVDDDAGGGDGRVRVALDPPWADRDLLNDAGGRGLGLHFQETHRPVVEFFDAQQMVVPRLVFESGNRAANRFPIHQQAGQVGFGAGDACRTDRDILDFA